jgi:DivIVA domain-containing protein
MPDDTEQPMSLDPSPLAEIPHKQFTVVLRGYDRDEVDQFLAQVEEAVQDLAERAAERPSPGHVADWLGGEVAAVLSAAEDAANKVRTEANDAAARVRAQAESDVREAGASAEAARSHAQRTRDEAEEAAAEIRLKAQEEAERILREARLVAERIENAAQSRRDEILAEARQGVRELEGREKEIHERIAALEETFRALHGMIDQRPPSPSEEEGFQTDENRIVDLTGAEGEPRKKSS